MQQSAQGPMGDYFEDANVGDVIVSMARTVTEADIVNFGGMIGDYNPLHFDAEYMKDSMFGQRIAHGMLTLSFATGLVNQLGMNHKTVMAFKGLQIEFKAPVFIGDTIHVELTISETRKSNKQPGGWITQQVKVIKQDGTVVQEGQWTALIASRPQE